ncbi:benzoate/H(+) symporter BenE family transporter [Aquabacter sp. CN5-332]|uniref:benzoate/H(+) symporter BenE family transporter n=1 Tax=Aquabacter sp. CN5-332 TaxID=3156608 RepID=UPI0032B3FF6C
MRLSIISSSFVAAVVGFGGTVALPLAAAGAVGASPTETSSYIAALCIGVAVSSTILSVRYKMPLLTAWSTPGSAVIASFGGGIGMSSAVGAFMTSAILITACAAIRPLASLVSRIPMSVAAAMLAGVLVRFPIALVTNAGVTPALVLPLLALFFLLRLWSPSGAVLGVLLAGAAAIFALGLTDGSAFQFVTPHLVFVPPTFDLPVVLGLGIPLFIVTMAAQNLPGFAVLRAGGYWPPTSPALAVTGLTSLVMAFFCASGINLAAITAAICTGPDTHPDPAKRYLCGPWYGLWYVILTALGATLVAVFAVLPPSFIATVAGLALLSPLTGALASSLQEEKDRLAAVATFITTASGIAFFGLGAPFWGLAAGLGVLGLDHLKARFATMQPHG